MKNEELNHALDKWEIDLPDDPRFRSSVWREIAMRDAVSPVNRFREALDRLMTPRLAIPVGAVAAIIVLLTATFHGEQSRQQTWNNLATAYSSAIDPIVHTETMAAMIEP